MEKIRYEMAEVLCTQISTLSWCRDIIDNKLVMWNNLTSRPPTMELRQERDDFKWNPSRYSKPK